MVEKFRPPVVVVLGHVDHGKTTLLDYIRKTRVAASEYGGITQKIGAYQIVFKGEKITFIDTPGHEAFSKMRSRGARVADIALLVIAANKGVEPQTKEAIKHIKDAKIPLIVVLNKTDLPEAQPEKVKKQLAKEGIIVEDLGGKIVCVSISAKTGKGVNSLLEMILLLSEIERIEGDEKGKLEGVIIESRLDPQKGALATILVRNGTLFLRDVVNVAGQELRIRAMFDDRGKEVEKVLPGSAAEVLGFSSPPPLGAFVSKERSKQAESPVLGKQKTKREEGLFKIILKTDTLGSQEAIEGGFNKKIEIVEKRVGNITNSDVVLAKATGAVIIGFNVHVPKLLLKLAQEEKVFIKTYNIIYKLFEELDEVVNLKLKGEEKEILGEAKIIAEFQIKKEKIAGVKVIKGRLVRGDRIKIIRPGGQEISSGRIKTIKHLKEDVSRADVGGEYGIGFTSNLDFQLGDSIISHSF